ncbi:uncharacterized protein N7503_009025 [Penicillium pulvis]|uniref:uncharacterized protein n=1 Tax=Penicillium pulvis TaxID=1562058 RepID=UPI0025474201|nr:uncharacterized protein N7503_009025 [Penicillium pulvis]KAJ5793047.1 hypothetical protein N7503_009025 [Penicillium pulvis]
MPAVSGNIEQAEEEKTPICKETNETEAKIQGDSVVPVVGAGATFITFDVKTTALNRSLKPDWNWMPLGEGF